MAAAHGRNISAMIVGPHAANWQQCDGVLRACSWYPRRRRSLHCHTLFTLHSMITGCTLTLTHQEHSHVVQQADRILGGREEETDVLRLRNWGFIPPLPPTSAPRSGGWRAGGPAGPCARGAERCPGGEGSRGPASRRPPSRFDAPRRSTPAGTGPSGTTGKVGGGGERREPVAGLMQMSKRE